MNHKPTSTRVCSLLAVGGVCLLMTGNAHAQRAGARRASSTRAASSSSTTGTTTGTASTNATSGTTTCPASGSTSSSGTTTGTTTTGTTTGTTTSTSGTTSSASSVSQVQTTSLGSGTVSAVRTASNQLAVQWAGNTSNVKAVYIAVLNANHQAVQQQAITQAPARTTLTLTSAAKYYGVQVVYTNGTSTVMTAPIR